MSATPETPQPRARAEAVEVVEAPDTAPRFAGIMWVITLASALGLVVTVSVALALIEIDYDGDGTGMLFAAVGFAVTGAALYWFLWWMRRRGAARPGELPAVVLVAVVTGVGVGFLRFEWSVLETVAPVALALGCAGLALAGAVVVWMMPPQRIRAVLASGLVLALGAVLVGWSWLEKRADDEYKNGELSREVAAVGYPIAGLDTPGWEVVAMWVSSGGASAAITYAPLDQQVAGEGFTLTLRTEPVDPEEDRWRPGWENCSVDGGRLPCEEHGAVVLVDQSEERPPYVNTRVELVEGVVATLWTEVPTDVDGGPVMEMPDVDMVGLAEQIRPLEGGEAQRVVEEVR